ncbi:BrnT family toxin [Acetobacter lovaniensis]|uniref:BrnT family toxin n=2 Tax=Acetobacter lovaniensis TaxID=104100 RepID=A0A841QJD6_9PROT|nr:BrnT family toxin [Acetobacter lovaniensis]MBB6458710.1 hypothetical protein [Acetobacter lovaniensis]NHN82915.1 BrnT family toxin [Acetobacter lovaniensis]
MQWVWSKKKDEINRQKHKGISLAIGAKVLENDPNALTEPDPHDDDDRWQTIGRLEGYYFVVHTDLEEMYDGTEQGRIISVRQATRAEIRRYEARFAT